MVASSETAYSRMEVVIPVCVSSSPAPFLYLPADFFPLSKLAICIQDVIQPGDVMPQ